MPLVLTPLEFERRALRRAGLDASCELICSGPGFASTAACARALGPTERPVVLAGLAAALADQALLGRACRINLVLDPTSGRRWRPTLALDGATDQANAASPLHECSVASVQATLTSGELKADLRRHSGADLVDLESSAFAEAATEFKWSWAIVRGISDGPLDALPAQIDSWIDHAGRARLGAILGAVVSKPPLLADLLRLRARGTAAMEAVAAAIGAWVDRNV